MSKVININDLPVHLHVGWSYNDEGQVSCIGVHLNQYTEMNDPILLGSLFMDINWKTSPFSPISVTNPTFSYRRSPSNVWTDDLVEKIWNIVDDEWLQGIIHKRITKEEFESIPVVEGRPV